MRRDEFRTYLANLGITNNGVNSRISWCEKVERDFNVDLAEVVRDIEETQNIRRQIYDNVNYTKRQRRNFPNGIKKYFEFVNGYELPRMN